MHGECLPCLQWRQCLFPTTRTSMSLQIAIMPKSYYDCSHSRAIVHKTWKIVSNIAVSDRSYVEVKCKLYHFYRKVQIKLQNQNNQTQWKYWIVKLWRFWMFWYLMQLCKQKYSPFLKRLTHSYKISKLFYH